MDYPFMFYNGWRSNELKVYDWSRSDNRRLTGQDQAIPNKYNKVLVSRHSNGNKDHVLVYHEDYAPSFFEFDRDSSAFTRSSTFPTSF